MMDEEAEVTAIIRRARQLIQQGWCQDSEAVDADGRSVWPGAPDAVAFCARGAIRRAAFALRDGYESALELDALARVEECLPAAANRNLPWYNDHRTLPTLLRLLDRAAGGK